ncbi:MAG: nucleoside deaminase [Acidimicrobiia bacterium]|nr:nucleoside deaminase [Acidimicrobiia bacterium]
MEIRYPTAADLAAITDDAAGFVDRLLDVVEHDIVPLTREGVARGNKLFGGAVLDKADLSVVVAVTNRETANPINHGEISTINAFYELDRADRPAAADTIFLSTHEPCPLCLGAITWGGWNNFFYVFSYEDSMDAFAIPHDIRLNEEIWRVADGEYDHKNRYWCAWSVREVARAVGEADRARLLARLDGLRGTYDELSEVYQASKGQGAEIPLP